MEVLRLHQQLQETEARIAILQDKEHRAMLVAERTQRIRDQTKIQLAYCETQLKQAVEQQLLAQKIQLRTEYLARLAQLQGTLSTRKKSRKKSKCKMLWLSVRKAVIAICEISGRKLV